MNVPTIPSTTRQPSMKSSFSACTC